MADDPAEVVLRGAATWNDWRARNAGSVTFANPHWYDSPGPGGTQIKGRNMLDFVGINCGRARPPRDRRRASRPCTAP